MKITRQAQGKKTVTIERIGKLGRDSWTTTVVASTSFRCKRPELLLSIVQQRGKKTIPLLKFLVLYVELGRQKYRTF